MDEQLWILEKARIIMAQELDIPPDDININAIYESAFRAIRESFESDKVDIILTLKNKREEEALLNDIGREIINRLFNDQHPFDGIVENYKEWYVNYVLNNIDEKDGY